MAFIYALVHPETKEVRYVGATTKKPERRYKDHFLIARHKRKTPVQNWILKLEKFSLRPEQIVIEEVEDSRCADRERYWIQKYRNLGYRLLNVGEGGEGIKQEGSNISKTYKEKKERRPEVAEKLKESAKKARQFVNTPEMRKAQSERMKGNNINKTPKGGAHFAAKRIVINGIEYPSAADASRELGLHYTTVLGWIKRGKAHYLP